MKPMMAPLGALLLAWPVLTQGAKSPHDALLLSGTRPAAVALRMGDWKYVRHGTKEELFHLAADLGETKDLAGRQPEKLNELRARWSELKKSNVPPGNRANRQVAP